MKCTVLKNGPSLHSFGARR